jgi:hypothetical protein
MATRKRRRRWSNRGARARRSAPRVAEGAWKKRVYRVRGRTPTWVLPAERGRRMRWGAANIHAHPGLSLAESVAAESRWGTYLSSGSRYERLLYYTRHRRAGPLRAGTRPVLGFAFAPGSEDSRPEHVL